MDTRGLSPAELKALLFIRDSILYHERAPSYRGLGSHLGFKSPRSAYVLVDRLIEKGFLEKTLKGTLKLAPSVATTPRADRTIEIPLVGSAPCGLPLLAEENVEMLVPVSQRLARPGARYFLLRAMGTSMDQAGIADGDLVLVRQQPVADNGDRVVALIDDSATIKEFHRRGNKVVLMPRSTNPEHKPIILEEDFSIQGVVIDTLPNPLE